MTELCPGCRSKNTVFMDMAVREGGRSVIYKFKCLDCRTSWETRN